MNKPPYRILAVCLGNICRSPLAEALLEKEAERRGLNWEVDSAGTSGWHQGELPDPRSRAVGQRYGLDLTKQRSRKLLPDDLDSFDLILAMDRQNARNIRLLLNGSEPGRAAIEEILTYAGLAEEHGPDVIDPYHDDNGFESVYHLLARAAAVIADRYEADQLDKH